MSEMQTACINCIFWSAQGSGSMRYKVCRRGAPMPLITAVAIADMGLEKRTIARWPETMADDWCGEFQAREAKE